MSLVFILLKQKLKTTFQTPKVSRQEHATNTTTFCQLSFFSHNRCFLMMTEVLHGCHRRSQEAPEAAPAGRAEWTLPLQAAGRNCRSWLAHFPGDVMKAACRLGLSGLSGLLLLSGTSSRSRAVLLRVAQEKTLGRFWSPRFWSKVWLIGHKTLLMIFPSPQEDCN